MQGDPTQNLEIVGRSRLRYLVPVLVALPFLAIAAAAVLLVTSRPAIEASQTSLAAVSLPLGGGRVTQVVATGGREQHVIPVRLEGHQIVPSQKIPAGERLTLEVTVRRPGWNSWLTGKQETLKLTETTPVAHLTSAFLTRRRGQPVSVSFDTPVATAGHGAPGTQIRAEALSKPQQTLELQESAVAGTAYVVAAARPWEQPTRTEVTWFPAGSHATAVATPDPGTRITPNTRIKLTFSKPVTKVLGKDLPPVSPRTAGTWHQLNTHTIAFIPEGYGYGLGADVKVSLPSDVNLVGGQEKGSDPIGQWTVPDGSTLALQQLLAQLGYLPVVFTPSGGAGDVAATPAAEEAAIVNPPQGTFSWRYPDTPPQLKALWSPTDYTELTKGAVMAFEQDQGLATDGLPGPDVWKALINAVVKGQKSNFGYTFVMVSESDPESIQVWHNGRIVVHGLVNTGIAAAPTATGTYAVYEHLTVTTMSGTNPDGTPYHDPGIPWVSYFNGGDALHGFIRSSYGFPQSLGCVEMPYSQAGDVYPYTPIGTIVHLTA